MTLSEFVADQQMRLSEFIKWWSAMNVIEPEMYPLEMTEGGWDEQFDSYHESVRGTDQ